MPGELVLIFTYSQNKSTVAHAEHVRGPSLCSVGIQAQARASRPPSSARRALKSKTCAKRASWTSNMACLLKLETRHLGCRMRRRLAISTGSTMHKIWRARCVGHQHGCSECVLTVGLVEFSLTEPSQGLTRVGRRQQGKRCSSNLHERTLTTSAIDRTSVPSTLRASAKEGANVLTVTKCLLKTI